MKTIRVFDNNGVLVVDFTVNVVGDDATFILTNPVQVSLGRISIMNEEKEEGLCQQN